jgi:hypothetical protein
MWDSKPSNQDAVTKPASQAASFDELLPIFSVSKVTNARFEPRELLEVAAPS